MPQFTDDYGVAIVYDEWVVEHPRAAVQIVHGVGEHAGRYAELADELNEAGFSVYADDHRGHGRTGMLQWDGDASKLGRLGAGGHRAAVTAVHRFSEMVGEANPDVPLILLGHSWGSFIAQLLIDRYSTEYDLLVLSGTAYRMPGSMNSGDLNARHKHLGDTGAEWLSRDPLVAQAFADDPLTTLTPLTKLFGIRDALRLIGRPARKLPSDIPVLIQVGDDDPLGGEPSARKLAQAYRTRSGLTDVTVQVYPGARHEVYNETNRREVIADLIEWLDAELARAA
jgi:alpha-beta hydrolase superfamily lysophospholipase